MKWPVWASPINEMRIENGLFNIKHLYEKYLRCVTARKHFLRLQGQLGSVLVV